MAKKQSLWPYVPNIILCVIGVLLIILFFQVLNLHSSLTPPNTTSTMQTPRNSEAFANSAALVEGGKRGLVTPHGSRICHPGCCPSALSCANGCVCMDKEDANFFSTRGNNAGYQADD
jgi:hypothetical protein